MNSAYDEKYINSMNINFDYNALTKLKLADGNKLNKNYYILFNYVKNVLDNYLLSNCNQKDAKFDYGIRFDLFEINQYIEFINLFNNKETEKLNKFIVDNCIKICEYSGENLFKISNCNDAFSFTNPNINIKFQLANDLVQVKPLIDIDTPSVRMKEYPRFLPLGSVIKLIGRTKLYFIGGYLGTTGHKEIYDYIVLTYPGGTMVPGEWKLVKHSEIRDIVALGLNDLEQQDFLKKIPELLEYSSYLVSVGDNNESNS